MLHSFQTLLQSSVLERLTLLANHVIASEPVARDRLAPWSGRTFEVRLEGWPTILPRPPVLAFMVTPAGLLEWVGSEPPMVAELNLHVDASNPARTLSRLIGGSRPRIDIDGDAAFAADLSWIIDNLKWDVTDDLARIVGPGAAHQLARIFGGLAAGLRQAVEALRTLADKAGRTMGQGVDAMKARAAAGPAGSESRAGNGPVNSPANGPSNGPSNGNAFGGEAGRSSR